jgi:hypothetical protein
MFLKALIITVILVAIVMLALGVKLLFNKDAEFTSHSCVLEDGNLDEEGACYKFQLKDLANCPEKEEDKNTNKT